MIPARPRILRGREKINYLSEVASKQQKESQQLHCMHILHRISTIRREWTNEWLCKCGWRYDPWTHSMVDRPGWGRGEGVTTVASSIWVPPQRWGAIRQLFGGHQIHFWLWKVEPPYGSTATTTYLAWCQSDYDTSLRWVPWLSASDPRKVSLVVELFPIHAYPRRDG